MAHKHKKKKSAPEPPTLSEKDYYMMKEGLKDIAKGFTKIEGHNLGNVKDAIPLGNFICGSCRREGTAMFIYEGGIGLYCIQCSMMEIIGGNLSGWDDILTNHEGVSSIPISDRP